MPKKYLILALLAVFAAAAAATPFYIARAAVPVYDAANTAQTHATYLQAAQNVLNTATQIANQVTELTSMDANAMSKHINGVSGQVNEVAGFAKQAKGLMSASTSAEQAWEKAFSDPEQFFTDGTNLTITDRIARGQKMSNVLNQTYEDALRIAKSNMQIDQDIEQLQDMMEQNKNAVGNKQAIQTQNALLAQQNALLIKQNQNLAALAATMAGNYSQQNQTQALATALAQQQIKAGEAVLAAGDPLAKALGGK